MKSIFVPAGGSESDEIGFETALAIAKSVGAHLEFFHAIVDPREAVHWQRHADLGSMEAIQETMYRLRLQSDARTTAARTRFHQFCERHHLPIADLAGATSGVSVNWREESGDAEGLVFRARHHDLVVIGRPAGPTGLPPDLLERMLIGCGKPLLIPAAAPPASPVGPVIVCWKETPEAARAVTAALPLLVRAERVVLAGVEEKDPSLKDGLAALSRQLLWHGIAATIEYIPAKPHPVHALLMDFARSLRADLLVMGGYGHNRLRETIFGGVTRAVLAAADIRVLMIH